MKSNILKFDVVKEEISAENVLEMSEVIAFAQTPVSYRLYGNANAEAVRGSMCGYKA